MATNKDFIVKNGLSVGEDISVSGSVTSNLQFDDSVQLQLGTDSDLLIYHDGTDSYIDAPQSGHLYIQNQIAGKDLRFRVDDGTGSLADFIVIDSSVQRVKIKVAGSNIIEAKSSGIDVTGDVDITGSLTGPASFVIDPAAVGDNTGEVVIKGNLQVDGTTTTINSTTLTVDDKNIVLGSGSANAAAADGAGISVDITGVTNPEWNWYVNSVNTGVSAWESNYPVVITQASTGRTTNLHLVNETSAASTEVALEMSVISPANDACDVRLVAHRRQANAGSDFYIETTNNSSAIERHFTILEDGNVGIGFDIPQQNLAISVGTNEATPTLGTASGAFSILKDDSADSGSYGLITGLETSGNVWSQVQRVDGTATSYHLKLQPAGGKVAIGTSWDHPIGTLDVGGNVSLSTTGTGSRFVGFYQNVVSEGTNDLKAFIEKNGNNFTIYNDDAGDLQISNAGGTKIKINSSGFVGVGPTHDATAQFSILTPGATGGPNTLAFNVINNGNQFDINGLAAYNDTTSYDVVQKASLTYHGRGQTSGNITTNVSGSSGGTHTNRFVNLNSPQTVSPMSQDVYYQYSGSGNTNTEMAVSEDQILKHVSTYNGGGVDTKFIKYANGDNWIKGSYRSDDLRHSVQPSLNLDFANTKQLDSRINFLRDSIGTYFDQDGVMRYAGINEPRFDHDPITGESLGLLIEEDRQNNDNCSPGLFTWSDLNTKREHNTNETLAPDGTFSATKVRCTPSTGVHRIAKYVGTIGAGQVTFSVYAKAGTATLCLLRESNITGVQGGGAITGGEHVGNGWYRLSIEYTDNGSSNYYPSFYIGTTSTSNVTTTGEEYIYLWGAQVELSEHRSSLIPTLKSMVYDSRSSAATYHDADGNLRTAPRDTLRYSHHYDGRKWIPTGPLLEDSAVNEVGKTTYMFANPYSNGNYNLDAYDLTTEVTSPDGSYTASKVFSTNSSTFNYSSHYSLSAAFSNGTVHVNSIYAKMGTVRYLWMSMPSTSEPSATFDLQDGVVARTGAQLLEAGMIDVGNGWYRCYTIGVVAGSPSQSAITVSLGTTNSNRTANSGDYVYLWGKQIEIDKLTSHMPNHLSTSQTIRSADVGGFQKAYRMNDIVEMYDVGHLIGNDVGTVYTHWQTLEPNDGFGGVFEIWDSGTNGIDQRFTAYYLTNNYSVSYAANPEQGVFRKTALAYDSSSTLDSQSVINGALQSVNTVHTWNMNLTRIRIGSIDLNAAYQLNGHIKEFRLYKDRLTNPELIALTEND